MTSQYWIGAAVGLLLHEAAHALVTVSVGLEVKQAGICRRGLFIRREAGTPVQDALIAAAGPLANMLLCLGWLWSPQFALANLVFAVIYSMPLKNSDGSHFLSAIARWRASRPQPCPAVPRLLADELSRG